MTAYVRTRSDVNKDGEYGNKGKTLFTEDMKRQDTGWPKRFLSPPQPTSIYIYSRDSTSSVTKKVVLGGGESHPRAPEP